MEVSAFDYETSARARIGAEVSEPGTVLAPGRLLAEIAGLLPGQPADLAEDGAGLIPAEFTATAVIDAAGLAETVKRLAVVAARDTPVRLAFTPGQVNLTADSGDEADGTDAVGCELDGDPITVAFHPRRLLDAVTATGTGRARIALTTPAKPAMFTPADDDQDDDAAGPGHRHLLMPIRSAG